MWLSVLYLTKLELYESFKDFLCFRDLIKKANTSLVLFVLVQYFHRRLNQTLKFCIAYEATQSQVFIDLKI